MKDSDMPHRIYGFLVSAYEWYLNTPQRSLDEAYKAAVKIRELEGQYFNNQKVTAESANYGNSVMDFFEDDLRKQLKNIQMRLTEFRASIAFINFINPQTNDARFKKIINSSEVLAKLGFIDEVTAKYNDEDVIYPEETPPPINDTKLAQIESAAVSSLPPNPTSGNASNLVKKPRSKTDATGILPRSILSTINRLQVELDPKSEQEVVKSFRTSQRRTSTSIRFILLLIIVPVLTHQLAKAFVVGPIVDRVRGENTGIFLNYEMEEEALGELQKFEERLKFDNLLLNTQKLSIGELEIKLKEKAQEIAEEYRSESASAVKNLFADMLSVIAFAWLLLISKREIAVLKEFFDNIVYGLSDSAKAFIIILFTDVFVGFHSPHGWEVILEGISRHLGLPGNHDFIFLFIATFPVILDTIFKYWIFRYLNRISPSAVATYRNMNE
ncbi:MAG: proton extrusion protein PcxA [Nostocaceae cyanobacterium]|nr:proton extrusion protein PcxA [Nostocaceae cyanobacterium]